MKRRSPALALLVVATFTGSSLAQAHDGSHDVAFNALPCATACAYWTPFSELGYMPCENPFPEGSYQNVLTEPAPEPPDGRKMLLVFKIRPKIDWDSWICSYPDYRELAAGVHDTDFGPEPCDNLFGPDNPVPIGCPEKALAPAEAGKQYVLRAYNFSDIYSCPGTYRWVFV